MPVETPGQVLTKLRKRNYRSAYSFAHRAVDDSWSEDTQRRLEQGATKFVKYHLDNLVEFGVIKKGDEDYQRFEAAMAGKEWPNKKLELTLGDGDGEVEQIHIPIDLKGKTGRFRIILEIVAVLVVAFVGLFVSDSTVAARIVRDCIEPYVRQIFIEPDRAKVGTVIRIGITSEQDCFDYTTSVYLDGELINQTTSSGTLVSRSWVIEYNTSHLTPGRHEIVVSVPYFWEVPKVLRPLQVVGLIGRTRTYEYTRYLELYE